MTRSLLLAGAIALAAVVSAKNLDVPVVGAECTRDALRKIAKNYIESSGAYPDIVSVIDMSLTSKVSQNNQKRTGPLDTAISSMIAFPNHFQIQALDTSTCNVATVYVPTEYVPIEDTNDGSNSTAITSIRIQMNPEWDNIEELEIVNALPGAYSTFSPESIPTTAPAEWAAAASPQATRDQLIKLANAYPSGLASGTGAQIEITSSCVRYENGGKVPMACNYLDEAVPNPVVGRRWVADPDTGVVVGMFLLDKAKSPVQLHDYFKIQGGKISEIFAVINKVSSPVQDFWSGAQSGANNGTLRYSSSGGAPVRLIHNKRWAA